jgi:hypothetical protein
MWRDVLTYVDDDLLHPQAKLFTGVVQPRHQRQDFLKL